MRRRTVRGARGLCGSNSSSWSPRDRMHNRLEKIKRCDKRNKSRTLGVVRSYRQYCGLARGLDLIGDRWVLLIVRELLPGPRRYGELLDGLPGIATNLLAERLRSMEDNGLVTKGDDDRYRLTERGKGLRDVVYAIGRWAYPLIGATAPDETFRGHWIAQHIGALFPGEDDTRPELTIEVRCGDESMTVRSSGGRVTVAAGPASAP